jgi:hypothetical protein
MSTLAITVNVSNPDEEDRRAMDLIIARENERRAALVPPGTPLPNSTAAERKSSYESLIAPMLLDAHKAFIREAGDLSFRNMKARWDIATDAQRIAAANQLPSL